MSRRAGALAGAVVVATVLGLITWALWPRAADAAYVTAAASRGTITQTLALVGPVERDGMAEVSYTNDGLVTALHVRLGDQVAVGQPLVTVDAAPLRLAVLQARAQLAQAEAQLDADLAARESGAARTVPSVPSAPAGPGQGPSAPAPAAEADAEAPAYLTAMNASLSALQAAVVTQQEQCAPVFAALQQLGELQAALPTEAPSPPAPAAAPAEATTATHGKPGPSSHPTSFPEVPGVEKLVGMVDQVGACTAAMGALAQAEAGAGAAIGAAAEGLAESTRQAQEALAAAQAELQQAAQQASEEAVRQAQAQLEAQLAARLGGAVTDATIASDRARLLDARQRLASAEADLAGATLTSPISGTVGAADFVVGEGSGGRSMTVVGSGAARVTVEVPLSSRARVAPGVPAVVGQLAAEPEFTGQVASVSVLPSESSGGPTYATRVLADDPEQKLRVGSWAEVTLTLARATDVLTVPASALTKITDSTATVEVVDNPRDTEAERVTVVTGRTGGGRVEVVSGLADGALVVLADRRLPVPGGLAQYTNRMASASPTPAR